MPFLHEIIDAKGIPHELGYAGEIDLTSTAELKLLQPLDEAPVNLGDRDVNDDSLVLTLSYGEVDIHFRTVYLNCPCKIEQSPGQALLLMQSLASHLLLTHAVSRLPLLTGP